MIHLAGWLAGAMFFGLNAAGPVQAQAEQPSLPLDSKHCAFSGVFEQSKTLKGLTDPLNSSGSFYYHCEYGVIWKSEHPIAESLVFRKEGNAYTVNDQREVIAIKAQQGKVLGRLLNDLIGADLAQLAKTFSLEQLNSSAVRFTPRKRRLKRALKLVDLAVKEEDGVAVEIRIVDRNEQLTQVSARQTHILEPQTDEAQWLDQCVQDKRFSAKECLLLINSDDAFSKQ